MTTPEPPSREFPAPAETTTESEEVVTQPEWFHCLRCDADVPASEVTEHEWMPGRIGTFHSCGDYAHPAWDQHAPAANDGSHAHG
jgi:hypothetical protein